MPAYKTPFAGPAIFPGDQPLAVFSAEQPASGTLSGQVAVARPYNNPGATSLAMEVEFDANPGAFNYTLATADTDTQDAYVKEPGGSLTTAAVGPNGKYYARLEINIKAKFAAVICVTQNANAVNSTVKLSI